MMLIRTVRVPLRPEGQDHWVSEMRAWGDGLERLEEGLVWATVGLAQTQDGWVGLVTSVWTSRQVMEARVTDPRRPAPASGDVVEAWTVDVVEVVGAWSSDVDPLGRPAADPLPMVRPSD